MAQYYATAPNVPKELMLEAAVPEARALGEALSLRRGNRVRVLVPRRGRRADYMETVRKNAEQHLKEFLTTTAVAAERSTAALEELAAALALPSVPQRIECYDISHVQGTNVVGSMVVFEGRAAEEERLSPLQDPGRGGQRRRGRTWRRCCAAGCATSAPRIWSGRVHRPRSSRNRRRRVRTRNSHKRPSLLLIDGGRAQLDAVVAVLRELDLVALPIAALAKQFEEIYLPDEREPVLLPRNSSALHLVQRVRDEAHRFAVAYHRSLRGKQQIASGLDGLAGVGPARKRALVRAFGSAAGVKRASLSELEAVPGISQGLARSIHASLNQES